MDIDKFTPLGAIQFVKLLDPANRTSGGVFLPESVQSNFCEAVILRGGAGWKLPGEEDQYALAWVQPTNRIVFQQFAFMPLYRGSRLGFVRDEGILGTVFEDSFRPLNDWVMIGLEDWKQREAGSDILLPEEFQRRPQRGRVLDYGPGRLITKGDLIGCRLTCPTRLQLSPAEFDGALVWWGDDTEIVEMGREASEFVLIRSEDLLGIEVNDG